ncbi:MAG: glycoside hydrolase family 2 TIM barrel-domain containing protein, partial [Pseudomonadota bacterium]
MSAEETMPRAELPRPQFGRGSWQRMNGQWRCSIDPLGTESDQRGGIIDGRPITIPFAPESQLSGIAHRDFMESIWYERSLKIDNALDGRRLLLHFGGVDWHARIFLDGAYVGEHFGGSTHFQFDITRFVKRGQNHRLTVHARDFTRSHEQPLGKQSRELLSYGCYYTRTTGIWQSVWLEVTGDTYLTDVTITPDLTNGSFIIAPEIAHYRRGLQLHVEASFNRTVIASFETPVQPGLPTQLSIPSPRAWSPETPDLYDLKLTLRDGSTVLDEVTSYAGLRSIAIEGDQILLNGEPIYLRFVLDQGFYPEGGWTAPSDAALKRDIELSMAMGFNGARLHQKVFEPRWHYWADKLGYLTWGESPSWGFDVDQAAGSRNFLTEWSEIVQQCRNHPSIIGWSPLNESGHRIGRADTPITETHRRLITDAATLTRRLDPSRPVNDSSGWVHRDTDIWTVHCYEQDPDKLRDIVGPYPEIFKNAPASEPDYAAEPYFLAEFGGAAWSPGGDGAEKPASRQSLS